MSVHGIDMYITHYVHTMSVRVYDMFVIFRFGIYMSTHIVKFAFYFAFYFVLPGWLARG